MGVLQIETRRERLVNLGGVRSATPNTGAQESARTVGDANVRLRESGRALGEGVATLGHSLLKAATTMTEFDRKIRADDFAMRYQAEMNAFMLGDGTAQNVGAINEDFKSGEEWARKVAKRREETEARLRKECGITDWEWSSRVRAMTNGFDEQWRARMASHAFQVQERRSQAAATGRRDTVEQTLRMGDGTHEMYGEWIVAMNNEAIAHHAGMARDPETGENVITDRGVYDAFMRRGALRLVDAAWGNMLKAASAKADGLERIEDVRKSFDEDFRALKREDGTYDFSSVMKDEFVQRALGENGLTGYEKSFEADFRRTRRAAEQAAESRRWRKGREVADSSTVQLTEMMLGEGKFGRDWDSLTPAQKADRYQQFLDSESGFEDADGKKMDWSACLKAYSGATASRIAATINRYKASQGKDDAKGAKAGAKMTADDYKYLLRQPVAYQTDESGNMVLDAKGQPCVVEFTPQMRMDTAVRLWQDGVITEADMRGIVSANRTEFSQAMKDIATDVLSELKVSCPKAVKYHVDEANGKGSFVFNPQGKVKTDDMSTGIKHGEDTWWFSGGPADIWEYVKYGDTVEALNLTQDWMMANPSKTKDDGMAYFRNLLQGKDADGKYLRLKIQDHMARERAQIGQLESNLLRGRAFSLGISPSGGVTPVPSSRQ